MKRTRNDYRASSVGSLVSLLIFFPSLTCFSLVLYSTIAMFILGGLGSFFGGFVANYVYENDDFLDNSFIAGVIPGLIVLPVYFHTNLLMGMLVFIGCGILGILGGYIADPKKKKSDTHSINSKH